MCGSNNLTMLESQYGHRIYSLSSVICKSWRAVVESTLLRFPKTFEGVDIDKRGLYYYQGSGLACSITCVKLKT